MFELLEASFGCTQRTSIPRVASENNVYYNQKYIYIRFNNNLKAGQTKVIWFDLKLDYNGFKLGYIPYIIQAGGPYLGRVKGPLFSSS